MAELRYAGIRLTERPEYKAASAGGANLAAAVLAGHLPPLPEAK